WDSPFLPRDRQPSVILLKDQVGFDLPQELYGPCTCDLPTHTYLTGASRKFADTATVTSDQPFERPRREIGLVLAYLHPEMETRLDPTVNMMVHTDGTFAIEETGDVG
ncbi:MAG: hypothetical protein M3534_13770, partial [Actinomycetota bacterium]|nr:hypothetical protein [Actinomycetota bacterium]